MELLIKELAKKWGIEGFNNHEQKSFEVGYIKNYFPNYLSLKKKLLESRDDTNAAEQKRLFNAMRIYIYTIFENLWFGYLLSYSEQHASSFQVHGKTIEFFSPFTTHLPSYSAAILHFGSCRDLFFILLKLCVDPSKISDAENTSKLITTTYNEGNFIKDLKTLSGNTNQDYIDAGKRVYKLNEFRNFFAHRMRLLWWHNRKCNTLDYFIKRGVYDAIRNRRKEDYKKHVFNVLEDHKSYESDIENSDCSDLVSSGEILRETHDMIASFFNNTLKFISNKI